MPLRQRTSYKARAAKAQSDRDSQKGRWSLKGIYKLNPFTSRSGIYKGSSKGISGVSGFRVQGFKGLGFRASGLKGLGFRFQGLVFWFKGSRV